MIFDYNQLFIKPQKKQNKINDPAHTEKRKQNIQKAILARKEKYDMRKKAQIINEYDDEPETPTPTPTPIIKKITKATPHEKEENKIIKKEQPIIKQQEISGNGTNDIFSKFIRKNNNKKVI